MVTEDNENYGNFLDEVEEIHNETVTIDCDFVRIPFNVINKIGLKLTPGDFMELKDFFSLDGIDELLAPTRELEETH
jgi:hypothetical protein